MDYADGKVIKNKEGRVVVETKINDTEKNNDDLNKVNSFIGVFCNIKNTNDLIYLIIYKLVS